MLESLFLGKKPDEESYLAALKDIAVGDYFSSLTKEDLFHILCS